MVKILEAVPNFSEGRDPSVLDALVDTARRCGVDVLDASADPDHHRSVVTYLGDDRSVVKAAVEMARVAIDAIDLREHRGVHPRVGALDVLPFVPLEGTTMSDAVAAAHAAGEAIAGLGVPIFYYRHASPTPDRGLASLRRGGFEGLQAGFPAGREPDLPSKAEMPHRTAGVTCVGAREVLLAWNVFVEGLSVSAAKEIASKIRERGGGFPGLRALGLELPRQHRIQISMNLEDVRRTPPLDVFHRIEREVAARGGEVVETQVIGMIPDALVLPSAADRLHLPDLDPTRVLSRQIDRHIRDRSIGGAHTSDDA